MALSLVVGRSWFRTTGSMTFHQLTKERRWLSFTNSARHIRFRASGDQKAAPIGCKRGTVSAEKDAPVTPLSYQESHSPYFQPVLYCCPLLVWKRESGNATSCVWPDEQVTQRSRSGAAVQLLNSRWHGAESRPGKR